ncbi:DNA recombination protein RmuC [Sphingorhabdus contaminans]|uniref:DNA recombination protein RmuC homolog n=2 Tax=Sphingorhabdus contaminans TaxID=1343899 RepID=A0A553WL27_9SPHN|nr:DNA recombination protein RmuC [Sphingorhabdus contaminans]
MRLSLDSVIAERDEARIKLAQVETALTERERAFEDQLTAMAEAKEILAGQFSEISQKLLHEAQSRFLQRADERFKESETVAGQRLSALLQPVHDRLEKYETAVGKVEAERREAFGNLHGLMESMRVSTEAVKTEAQRLGNSLRNAPKARGRWGEQQLRNVLESCGLSEHADFQTEVSMEGSEGRLRPDVILRVPGGRNLVIDAKVSLNAYQDAFEAGDEYGRENSLAAHAAAMKSHVNSLGQKAYQDQFEDTPDYVIMFVPGEHFLAAALEKDPDLWDFAFSKRVLLATPTNLIAIARTVAAVWKQEKMAGQAREIAELGKELYARLTTMGAHVGRMGKNLDTAVSAYNALVGSLESQVLTQAKRFEDLSIDTGGKSIEMLPVVDQTTRPMVKLVESAPKNEDAA